MERYFINGPINSLAIGTGGGPEVLRLCERGNAVTSVEHDATAKVGVCARMNRYPDLTNWACEVSAIEDFKSQILFHFVIMSQVLEHIQDDNLVIQKIASMSAPHARIIISTPTSLDGLLGRKSIVVPVATGPDHVRVGYQGPELDVICKSHGLFMVKRAYLGNPLLSAWWRYEDGHANSRLLKIVSVLIRPVVLVLSVVRYRPFVQISIYTKLP
jgi:hypothetical protein